MQLKSKCLVVDNTGIIQIECIQIKNKKKVAKIGDIIKVAVKSVTPTSKIKKGSVRTALIVKSNQNCKIATDGSEIKFNVWEVIIIEKGIKGKGWVPVGNRSTGLIPYWITSTQLKTLNYWPFETSKIQNI